ncbi:MAG: hypothetical protein Q9183_007439, partial [Haloplaca sp. 2 TL-2023]
RLHFPKPSTYYYKPTSSTSTPLSLAILLNASHTPLAHSSLAFFFPKTFLTSPTPPSSNPCLASKKYAAPLNILGAAELVGANR